MSELYNKLAAQTLGKLAASGWDINTSPFKDFTDRFAELIVRECAEFVDYRLTNPNGASIAWCDGSDIKEHFGVK
jgi:hypothetical protein